MSLANGVSILRGARVNAAYEAHRIRELREQPASDERDRKIRRAKVVRRSQIIAARIARDELRAAIRIKRCVRMPCLVMESLGRM